MKPPKNNIESDHNLEDCEDKIAEILADAMYEHIKKSPQKPDQKGDKSPMFGSDQVDIAIPT